MTLQIVSHISRTTNCGKSNPTELSARLLIRQINDNRWVENQIKRSDKQWVNEAVTSTMAQSWPWDSQVGN